MNGATFIPTQAKGRYSALPPCINVYVTHTRGAGRVQKDRERERERKGAREDTYEYVNAF